MVKPGRQAGSSRNTYLKRTASSKACKQAVRHVGLNCGAASLQDSACAPLAGWWPATHLPLVKPVLAVHGAQRLLAGGN